MLLGKPSRLLQVVVTIAAMGMLCGVMNSPARGQEIQPVEIYTADDTQAMIGEVSDRVTDLETLVANLKAIIEATPPVVEPPTSQPFSIAFPAADYVTGEPLNLVTIGTPGVGEDVFVYAWSIDQHKQIDQWAFELTDKPWSIPASKMAQLPPGKIELQLLPRLDGKIIDRKVIVVPNDTAPTTPLERVAVGAGEVGYQLTNGKSTDVITIANKHFFAPDDVIAGRDGERRGVRIVSNADTITIKDCVFENLTEAISVEQRFGGPPIKKLILIRCTIRNIYDAGGKGEKADRAQGLFTFNVQDIEVIDCYFDRVGYKPGFDARDIYSHHLYAGRNSINMKVTRTILNDASAHAFNTSETNMTLDGVIAANCAIHYGIKKWAKPPVDCWSVNVFDQPLTTAAKRGWDWLGGYPPTAPITIVGNDPIDWDAVLAAPAAERFNLAKSYLVNRN